MYTDLPVRLKNSWPSLLSLKITHILTILEGIKTVGGHGNKNSDASFKYVYKLGDCNLGFY